MITNPSIAYLLVLVGAYALIFEFMNPGLVLPGVVGTIALLIALYALQLLPVNYAGLALIAARHRLHGRRGLSAGLRLARGRRPRRVRACGSIILIDSDLPGFAIPYTLIGGVAAASAAFLVFVLGMLVRARRRPVVSGREQMLGAPGEALEDFESEGWARVHGENWRVRASGPVRRGERLRVTAMQGLILTVEEVR